MAQGATTSRLQVVHAARIEVEPIEDEPTPVRAAKFGNLTANLSDKVVLVFFLGACLAQIGDTITTAIALQRGTLFEENALMRNAVSEPVVTGALKLTVVVLLSLLAMTRLPNRYARLALLLAFGISALAPLQNTYQLLVH